MENNNSINLKRLCMDGMLLAMAVILGYVEVLIPINVGIPGFKPGLANIMTIIVIYIFGKRDAFIIGFLRVLIIGILFSGMFSLLYGVSGFLCSFIVMSLLKMSGKFGCVGISVSGAIAHNTAQLLVASFVYMGTGIIIYYLPWLILMAIATGILTGVLAYYCIIPVRKIALKNINTD